MEGVSEIWPTCINIAEHVISRWSEVSISDVFAEAINLLVFQ